MASHDPDDGAEVLTIGADLVALRDEQDAYAAGVASHTARALVRKAGGVPMDLEAERRVIGAVLLDPPNLRAAVDEGLDAGDFYKPGHAAVWRAIVDVDAAGDYIDVTRVVDRMRKTGDVQHAGAVGDVQLELPRAPNGEQVSSWARLVREKSTARRVLSVAEDLIAAVVANTDRAADLVTYAGVQIERVKTATAATTAFARELHRARSDIRLKLSKAKWEKPIGRSMLALAQSEMIRRPPIVQSLIPEGAVVVLAGAPKGGKTWLEDEIAVAIASGTKVVGEFYVNRPGPVMRICLEDAEEDIRGRNIAIARGRHQSLEEALENIVYESRFRLDLLDLNDVAGVIASARMMARPPAVICIDPLANAHSVESENDNAGMGRVLSCAGLLRDILGCSVLIVHHMVKSSAVDKKDAGVDGIFGKFRGAGAIRGFYDTGIAYDVKLRQPGLIKTHIDVETRIGRPPGPFGLQLDITDGPDDRADAASWSFWRNRDEMMGGAEADDGSELGRVLGLLRLAWFEAREKNAEPEPISATVAQKKLKIGNRKKVGELLHLLVERNQARHVGTTRNSGYVYYDAGGVADD